MANLLHRVHQPEETIEQVESPRRVPESREVEEHGRRVAGTPRRADTKVRWLGWVALILLGFRDSRGTTGERGAQSLR